MLEIKVVMNCGLDGKIIIGIIGLPEKPEMTEEVRNLLAESLGRVLRQCFPEAVVGCFEYRCDPENNPLSSEKRESSVDPNQKFQLIRTVQKILSAEDLHGLNLDGV